MRTKDFLLTTTKEVPAEAEIISHQLMLKAGLIRKLAGGLYTWMPLGTKVLHNVIKVVREEMTKSGALELLMPMVQPADLWAESGRLEAYGPELAKLNDRHERAFCLGPTHEEVITDIARHNLHSYRQLPVNFFQIQTKFRDEIRPRYGVMRAREFVMKDAYSFHLTEASLDTTYQTMFDTYHRIFNRLGLNFRAVQADNGSIGGKSSHEFHVLAETGEDSIAFSDTGSFAANIELIDLKPGDASPCGTGQIEIKKGIEVGHIFKLGTGYSESMHAKVSDDQGTSQALHMGCYGIGISRIVAASIEQHHDQQGILWPLALAPFAVAIVPLNLQKSPEVKAVADKLYAQLTDAGIEVLLDDRDERPGIKFADMELIGIPYQLVVGPKRLADQQVEIKQRCAQPLVQQTYIIGVEEAAQLLTEHILGQKK